MLVSPVRLLQRLGKPLSKYGEICHSTSIFYVKNHPNISEFFSVEEYLTRTTTFNHFWFVPLVLIVRKTIFYTLAMAIQDLPELAKKTKKVGTRNKMLRNGLYWQVINIHVSQVSIKRASLLKNSYYS